MTYPFSDCCPNLPDADPGCDDGWCCTHETWHEGPEVVRVSMPSTTLVTFEKWEETDG